VSGGDYQQRENAIANALKQIPQADKVAVLLEGLPSGDPILINEPLRPVQRIAPGCFCCIGNLVMRVSLNRLLRIQPQQIFIGIASDAHLDNVKQTLAQAPYDHLLSLEHSILLTLDQK
jgi:ABC-type Fe3+-hydroxamate transport system substrate-binding protein